MVFMYTDNASLQASCCFGCFLTRLPVLPRGVPARAPETLCAGAICLGFLGVEDDVVGSDAVVDDDVPAVLGQEVQLVEARVLLGVTHADGLVRRNHQRQVDAWQDADVPESDRGNLT